MWSLSRNASVVRRVCELEDNAEGHPDFRKTVSIRILKNFAQHPGVQLAETGDVAVAL